MMAVIRPFVLYKVKQFDKYDIIYTMPKLFTNNHLSRPNNAHHLDQWF